jgi:hypothetical protein
MAKLNFFAHTLPGLYTFVSLMRFAPMTWLKRLPMAWRAHKANSFRLLESYSTTIFDMQYPTGPLYFKRRDDSDRGGMSQIVHEYNEEEECMDVRGIVNTECLDKMTHSPFVGIAGDIWPTFKCHEANLVRIRFKGDGNTYKFHMDVANSTASFFVATVIFHPPNPKPKLGHDSGPNQRVANA